MTGTRSPAADASDNALFLQVQEGDPDAFAELFERLEIRAHRVAYGMLGDRARAEDAVQDSFLSVWRSRASYDPSRGSVVAWVLSIVRFSTIDSLRRNGRHDHRRAGEENIDGQRQALGDIEESAGERERAARLRGLLAQLPAAQREVIVLAYFGELTTTEIAAELSLPLGTVKGRMRLGLEKLRTEPL